MIALWSSLRAALGGAANGEVLASNDEPEGHAALRDEKKSLLRAMKDLEYENAVGKISDEDFERLDAAYRVRAKEVLSALDRDFAPYRARAEALMAEAVGAKAAVVSKEAVGAKAAVVPREAKASDEALRLRAKELREEAARLEKQLAAADEETVTESAPMAEAVTEPVAATASVAPTVTESAAAKDPVAETATESVSESESKS